MFKVKVKWLDFVSDFKDEKEYPCENLENALSYMAGHIRQIKDGRQWFVRADDTYAVVILSEIFREDDSPVLYLDSDMQEFEGYLKSRGRYL